MSTGAGSTPAGDVAAGFDPPGTVGSARAVKPPQALYLDAATMDFLTDEDGFYQEVHPIDHQVEMRLLPAAGSIASSKTVGSTLRDLAIDTRERMTADAARIVTDKLSDLIANGDVRVLSVVAYAANAWRAHVEISYQNLRAIDADRTRTVVQ
jgi:hypothetical protein